MTVLALKFAAWCNGVSHLHARVSRSMWTALWPDIPNSELPISGLTNGVHIPSWISNEMGGLYDRYLGPRWSEDPDNEKVWERALAIPDTELWRTHERRRERLVAFARRRLVASLQRTGATRAEIEAAWGVLNPSALTIGFARRFATYKRGVLIFHDLERILRLLNDPDRPVQIIFAGKAHPADNQGKEFIRRIVQLERDPRFRNRVVFIEDYDIAVARYLVQGVDVWLNNPRRPLEACGTSGMKAAANGALNLSVLDGWWDEACVHGSNGWAIGHGEEYTDEKYADEVESRMIYDLLEKEIVPVFYRRGADDLPHEWIDKMKNNLKTICPVFNSHRQVEDYMEMFYHQAAGIALRLKANEYAGAKKLAEWKERFERDWNDVAIQSVETPNLGEIPVSGKLSIRARVALGRVSPDELSVEAYYGHLDPSGEIREHVLRRLEPVERHDGVAVFGAEIPCERPGRFGIAVRVLPQHELNVNPIHSGIIKWG
jgi:glycogen phosphorylase